MRRILAFLACGLLLLAPASCSLENVRATVPRLVGLRLDAARIDLRNAGFPNLDVEDRRGNRWTVFEGDWVVVDQDPPEAASVAPHTRIRLGVVNADDPDIAGMLPDDSPAKAEILKKQADDAAKGKERADAEASASASAAAAKKRELDAWRNSKGMKVAIKLANTCVKALTEAAPYAVRGQDLVEVADRALSCDTGLASVETYALTMDVPSDVGMDGIGKEMADAATALQLAAQDMVRVADSGNPSAIASMRSNLRSGKAAWKKVVKRIG